MAKRFLTATGVVLVLLLLCGGAWSQGVVAVSDISPSGQEFAPDQLLVRFRPWVAKQRAAQILSERGAARIRRVSALGVDVLRLPPGLSVERAVEVFSRLPEVEFAEPNYILWAVAPSQTEIVDQWGLTKIQAPDAWGIISDKTPVLLAIVDTGIDKDHTDLSQNIWQNLDEIDGSPGIDDDGNGYVDDTWGWDFHNNDNDPFDDNMHGTVVSSVAAAAQDNFGVAGVCPWCQLAAVKVLGSDGSGYLDTVANGITYAADVGAKVISLSLGGLIGAQTLENAVNYAWGKGALVVAAAGNDGADARLYPAAYPNAMAVASTNEEDYRSCFSNYGEGYISIAAPGEAILGALPDQGYGTYSGTSLSTPHVSGLGGLLFSQDPNRKNSDVRNTIENTVNDLGPPGTDAYFGTGRINAYRAVMGFTDPTEPPAGLFSDDLSASGYAHARKLAREANGTLHMTWHGRDGGQYRVLYSSSNDGGGSWSQPQVVFSSGAETYHPALAIDGSNVYIAFPSKDGSSHYWVYFTHKPLSGGTWSSPVPLMGGSYHAVRPDLYFDPSNGKLHLVASSLDDAPYVYYRSSGDGGGSWSPVRPVNVDSTGGQKTRYADVHASGQRVYIAGRTVEFTFFGLIPRYRVFAIHSSDDGNSWGNLTELAVHDGWFSGEYGASLAGGGDRLYLAYEHAGAVYFRRSEGGASWSGAENVGSGAWPSLTQATDGQAWVMWESSGNLSLRHYTGTAWDPAESVSGGNYPNLKLGTTGGFVEWAATHCSGAPYRLTYGSRAVAGNDPPVANNQSVTTAEDAPVDITLTGSDSDGDPLTYSVVTYPTNGSLSGTPPVLTYTPNLNFYGSDSFTFKVNDGTVDSDPATVSITVTPVNDPPVANIGGPYSGIEDDDILFHGSGSSDPDGDSLSYSWDFGDHTTGTGISPSHAYAYGGTFTVTLTVSDGKGGLDTVSTTTTVEEVNDPPVADPNGPYTGMVGDPMTFDGSASFDPDNQDETTANDQTLTYTWDFGDGETGSGVSPSHAYADGGDYSVSLVVSDGVDSDSGMTTASVAVSNNPPVANDVTASGDEDTTIPWTPSVSDLDGDPLTCSIVTQSVNGSASVDPHCASATYTPNPDYNGADTFTYKANDGTGDSNLATVFVTVNPINDTPVTEDDAYSVDEGTTLTVAAPGVLGNDSDVDNDLLTAVLVSDVSNGTLSLNADGSFTYKPDANLTGTDSFTYKANDGAADSDTATVTITVNPVAPTAYVSVEVTQQSFRRRWKATAVVTITETAAEGRPIRRATVEGIWSGVYGGDVSRTTNKSGKVSFGTGWITTSGEVCFSVLRVVKDGQEYELEGKTMDCTSG